jgi:3-oxoacyl-[acyl-carrier protein] reductase
MPDRYQQLVNSQIGSLIATQLGLPRPTQLRRYEPGEPVVAGPVLLGGADGGRLRKPATELLEHLGAQVHTEPTGDSYAALVYDATGITDVAGLRQVYEFFHAAIRRMGSSARLLVLATPPQECADRAERVAQQALQGFERSAGKEMRNGSTANLITVAPGAEAAMESTLRFFLSGCSAYVSGQVVRIDPPVEGQAGAPSDWAKPLDGRTAVVTGAARGIGESIATILARDGAHVVCLDLPGQGEQLAMVARRIGGSTLELDITDADAPASLTGHLRDHHDGADIVVHNAGVTRDKTLAGMSGEQWDAALEINLASQLRLTDALVDGDAIGFGGRVVSVSSLSGIAGNRGQTNYAASKAGIIGMVEALAERMRGQGATINAVAPGFIETVLTAEVAFARREVGRRMNSLSQGGLPRDVGETIAWLAGPASGGLNGQTVRVCGQSLLGA